MRLPPETVYLPFSPGPFRMAMGLVAREPDAAFELDDQYDTEVAERAELLREKRELVFAALPESEADRWAVLRLAGEVLPRQYPSVFAREGETLTNIATGQSWNLTEPGMDPLELAGQLVQDDLCLMAPGPEGYVLTAGVLCFPSRWSLVEKLGQPMAGIHSKVPFYGEKLARPVDRFFGALATGKLVERLNWSLVDDPALYLPTGKWRKAPNLAITAENAGESVFLRVERQTLSRVGAEGSILFTIRVHRYPLSRIAADPAVARDLAAAVEALPEEMAFYKSVLSFKPALLAYLRG